MVLNRIISDQEAYRHLEGNSPAHIKASLMGPQLTVLVSHGSLLLGTWQGIYLCGIRRAPDPQGAHQNYGRLNGASPGILSAR